MPRVRARRKRVACLEGLWDEDVTRPYTIRRVLEMADELGVFKFAHLTCNTVAEFAHNLDLFRAHRGFGVLYLAFHGSPGRIELPAGDVSLEELSEMMRTGFRGWVVHFGTCATVKAAPERLQAFVDRTGVAMVMGYSKNVDWIESASTDLLLLSYLQRYVDLRRMWAAFQKRYPDLVELNGLSAYPS